MESRFFILSTISTQFYIGNPRKFTSCTMHPNLKPNYVGYVEVLLLGIKFPIFKIPFLFIKTIVLTTLLESMHHNNSNSINTQIVASHSTANEIRIFLFYISTEWDATIWILIELQ